MSLKYLLDTNIFSELMRPAPNPKIVNIVDRSMKSSNPQIGSAFDDYLEAEDLLTEANEIAIKRVIAWQLQQEITSKQMTKTSVAKAMGTSRAAVDRLLDPTNTSVTLNTLGKAASVLGKRIKIELVEG
ncbi:helix-turn-helix domain-containing protein [Chamaesiphon polymorphus]|nr:helix-turn-helix transcriptional regulator [Chamaesiphon polymorphus]